MGLVAVVSAGLALGETLLAAEDGVMPEVAALLAKTDELVKSGDKDAVRRHFAALWAETSPAWADAYRQVADLSLARINPFDPRTGDDVVAARKDVDARLAALGARLALIKQSRVQALTEIGDTVGDIDSVEAQACGALLSQENAVLAARVTAHGVGESRGPGDLPPREIARRLEAAAAKGLDAGQAEVRAVLASVGKGGESMEIVRALAKSYAGTVEVFLSTTADHAAALKSLTSVVEACPVVPDLWAQRSRARLRGGDITGAMGDLIVALVMEPANAAALTARTEFNATSRGPGDISLEPADETRLAQAALYLGLGGKPEGENDRVAAAARRNFGRKLMACSFLPDPAARKAALDGVLDQYRKNGTLRCAELLETIEKFDGERQAAANDVRAMLAVFNRRGPILAPEPAYWRMRFGLFLALDQKAAAEAALDVGAALEPGAAWVTEARGVLSKR